MATMQYVDPARGISFGEFSESCTLMDIQVYHLSLLSDPLWRPGLRRLVDFSGVTAFNVSRSDAQTIARRIAHFPEGFSEGKVALVAPQHIIFGMGRLFQALTEEIHHPVRVFRTRRDAMEWLGSPVEAHLNGFASMDTLSSRRRALSPL